MIKRFFRWLMFLFIDDSYVIEVYQGTWQHKDVTWGACWFEIIHSPYLNKYWIRMGGNQPKMHTQYQNVIKRLNQLKNGLH